MYIVLMPALANSPLESTPMVESKAPSGAGMSPATSRNLVRPVAAKPRAICATWATSLMRRAGTCGTAVKPAACTARAASVSSSKVWFGNSAMKMSLPAGRNFATSARCSVSLQVISTDAPFIRVLICAISVAESDIDVPVIVKLKES